MTSHATYYTFGNETFTDENHYKTLRGAKDGILFGYTIQERIKLFNDNHTSMIEKHVWNKEQGEYEVKSYTPFIISECGIRYFATTTDWNKANRYIQDFKLGIY